MTIISRITGTGLLLLFTIITGFWLSYSGRPLNNGIFTIHKLIAVGAVIFMVITMKSMLKTADNRGVLSILVTVAGLSTLALFVSGALLSIKSQASNVWLIVHRVSPAFVVIITVVTLYLLVSAHRR